MSEQRFTLEEAQVELDRRECAKAGHSWTVPRGANSTMYLEVYLLPRPTKITCERCGVSYALSSEAVSGDAGSVEDRLLVLLTKQREWSRETFGPGDRLKGVLDHIRKELLEVEDSPTDVTEWIDVVILALDGAWRAGYEPAEIVAALNAKYEKNRQRTWPDWRKSDGTTAIEHVRNEAKPDWLRTCPECKQGKHINCTDSVLVGDDVTPCSCKTVGHNA